MKKEWQDSELAKTHEKMKADYDRLENLEKEVGELKAQLHCVYEGAAQWEQEYKDCRSILNELVNLKSMKELGGDVDMYVAWERAINFLKKYQHQ